MRRFVAGLSLGLLGLAFGRPAPALGKSTVVDALLEDHDATIYVDPMLTRASPKQRNTPHVGDVNGDGVIDLVVSQDSADWGSVASAGAVWIYYGPIADGAVDMAAEPPDVLIIGAGPYQYLGYHLAVHDVNGDGTDDIAMTAAGVADPRCTGSCHPSVAHVFFGGTLAPLIDMAITPADVTIVGGTSRAIEMVQTLDVDADGIADLVLVSGNEGSHPAASGILYGRANWPSVIDLHTAPFDTEFPDLTGARANLCEAAVAAVGDVNGDGLVDLAMGDPTFTTTAEVGGELLLWLGNGARLPASLPRGMADLVLRGEYREARVGQSFDLGDFDGDGVDDVAFISAVEGMAVGGDVYVHYGRTAWPPVIGANAGADLVLRVGSEADWTGCRLRLADFDADGREDLAFTNEDFTPAPGRDWAGRAVVVLGLVRVVGDMPLRDYPRTLELWGADAYDGLGANAGMEFADLDADGRADLVATAIFGDGPGNVHAATSPGDLLLLRGCAWPTCCDLLRDDSIGSISPPDRSLASLLPLDGDHCHRWRHVSGEADRDTAVLADLSRPLVLYASPRTTNDLLLTKGPGDRVHVHY